jgi:hypothetical protein
MYSEPASVFVAASPDLGPANGQRFLAPRFAALMLG